MCGRDELQIGIVLLCTVLDCRVQYLGRVAVIPNESSQTFSGVFDSTSFFVL